MSHVETKNALEAALKAATLQLSRILAYQARLQLHATVQYAPPAPNALVKQLAHDADTFDHLCSTLEQRVLRAIAVLERDVRRANGIPAPPRTPPDDLAIMPFALPANDAPMQIDLTEEKSSPPPTAAAAAAVGPAGETTSTGGLLSEVDLSMPFQLPSSSAASGATAAASLSSSSVTVPTLAAPAPPTTAPPSAPAVAAPAPPPAFPDSTADDIDALLSSLNMPAFSAAVPDSKTTTSSSASAADAQAFDYSSLLLDPVAVGTATPPASSSHAIGTGLGLGLDVAPPAAGTVTGGGGQAMGTAAPPPPPSAAAAAAAAAAGTTSAPTAPPTTGDATQPQQQPAVASAAATTEEFDFASFDFAALGLAAPASASSVAPAGGGQDLDFSILTSGAAAGPGGSTAAGASTGSINSAEMMDIDELLKSLGGA
ncbi:hypothetical protein JCM3774_005342 [Rhodotorula dairenensis]